MVELFHDPYREPRAIRHALVAAETVVKAIRSTALPTLIDWPRDEAAHTGVPWECWWITATLDAGGRPFVAHVLLLHFMDGSVQATANVTDITRREAVTRTRRMKPGEAVVAMDELRVATELCSFEGSFAEGYRLRAELDGVAGFDLLLRPAAPILYNGGAGQFAFAGVTTSQYSIGFLETSGTLRLNGQTLDVSGSAWYDRQWDHDVRKTPVAFTWFGLCLGNGDTLSFFDTRAGAYEGHRWATIAQADGRHIIAAAEPVSFDGYKTEAGRAVPNRWSLTIPARQGKLELSQQGVVDQAAIYTAVLHVGGVYAGEPATGYGFCDMVGPIADGP